MKTLTDITAMENCAIEKRVWIWDAGDALKIYYDVDRDSVWEFCRRNRE